MASLGANPQFLSEPPPDHFCPVCMEALIEPYLTDCGHHFCYTCRGRLLASGKSGCPECCEQDFLTDARLNKHLQRQVNSLKVRCQHHEVGCQWVGELRYLQEHLDPVIAERLSARHVIAEYCVEIVCLYICIYIYIYMSRLGMQSVHMARPIL